MSAQKSNFTWKNKIGIFVIVLVIFFFLFDVASLSGIKGALHSSDISDQHLRGINNLLFKIFMLKFLEMIILIFLTFGLMFWVLKPYWDIVQKIIDYAWNNPALKESVQGMDEDIDRANRALDALEKISVSHEDVENNPPKEPLECHSS